MQWLCRRYSSYKTVLIIFGVLGLYNVYSSQHADTNPLVVLADKGEVLKRALQFRSAQIENSQLEEPNPYVNDLIGNIDETDRTIIPNSSSESTGEELKNQIKDELEHNHNIRPGQIDSENHHTHTDIMVPVNEDLGPQGTKDAKPDLAIASVQTSSEEERLSPNTKAETPAPVQEADPSIAIAPEVISIVICADKDMFVALVTLMNSIIKNTRRQLAFFLIADTAQLRDDLKRATAALFPTTTVFVKFYEQAKIQGHFNVGLLTASRLLTSTNFARFVIPDFFPQIQHKFIYLDADVLVRGDIGQLYDVFIPDDKVIAVKSAGCERNILAKHFNFTHPVVVASGMKPTDCAFNAGVLVANVPSWKRLDMTKRLQLWFDNNQKYNIFLRGASQPPMLAAFSHLTVEIPPEWHLAHMGWKRGNLYSKAMVENAKLMHWNGADKPWKDPRQTVAIKLWQSYALPTAASYLTVQPDAQSAEPLSASNNNEGER